jgi:energy-coupling factor transport system ATP-binding protein
MLELREVCFTHRDQERGSRPLLDGVNLGVEGGEYVAILGKNAAGKTTLARLIKGLLHPSSGEILVDGQPIRPGEVSPSVGLILSNPDDQLLFPLVEEEISFGLECIGMDREMIGRRVTQYLSLLGMEKFLRFPLPLLSKSQQQRVAIAAALALEPDYLLLDGATFLLDPLWKSRLLSIVSELNSKRGMAIINFTTSLEEASHAHLILILEDGALPRFITRGYCLPPVVELSLLLKQMGHPIPGGILRMEEMEAFLLTAVGS